jgi:hypothetical protein
MWSNGEKSINVPFNHNRFVCVDYPGVVKNVDKALKFVNISVTEKYNFMILNIN